MSKKWEERSDYCFFSYINDFNCLFIYSHACYLNLCFWEMVGWFDWCYHIGLITNMHLKGYWTWKVLKDITKFCGSKWLALSNVTVTTDHFDPNHSYCDWYQQMTLKWLDLLGLYLILCSLCCGVFGTMSVVFVLIVSYVICTFLITWFESTKAITKCISVIVRENTASKNNYYL